MFRSAKSIVGPALAGLSVCMFFSGCSPEASPPPAAKPVSVETAPKLKTQEIAKLVIEDLPEEARPNVEKYDANHDGAIDDAELASISEALGALGPRITLSEKLASADTNGDDDVTREEMSFRLAALLDTLEIDTDGYLDARDLNREVAQGFNGGGGFQGGGFQGGGFLPGGGGAGGGLQNFLGGQGGGAGGIGGALGGILQNINPEQIRSQLQSQFQQFDTMTDDEIADAIRQQTGGELPPNFDPQRMRAQLNQMRSFLGGGNPQE